MSEIVGKIYLKADNSVNFDLIKFENILYVKIENTNLEIDLFNKRYFDIYYDIKEK